MTQASQESTKMTVWSLMLLIRELYSGKEGRFYQWLRERPGGTTAEQAWNSAEDYESMMHIIVMLHRQRKVVTHQTLVLIACAAVRVECSLCEPNDLEAFNALHTIRAAELWARGGDETPRSVRNANCSDFWSSRSAAAAVYFCDGRTDYAESAWDAVMFVANSRFFHVSSEVLARRSRTVCDAIRKVMPWESLVAALEGRTV